jgi:anti-anti-sigma factor
MMRSRLADLDIEVADGVVVAKVSGEIDSSNAGELRLALLERLSNTVLGMVLDLTGATYVDSTGIALLFELARGLEARRQLFRLVVPPSGPVRRVLDLCALSTAVPVDDDAAAAMSALRARAPG